MKAGDALRVAYTFMEADTAFSKTRPDQFTHRDGLVVETNYVHGESRLMFVRNRERIHTVLFRDGYEGNPVDALLKAIDEHVLSS